MTRTTALAPRPAAAIVADAAGARLPSYVTREQARAIINAAETTAHRLLLECLWQSGAVIGPCGAHAAEWRTRLGSGSAGYPGADRRLRRAGARRTLAGTADGPSRPWRNANTTESRPAGNRRAATWWPPAHRARQHPSPRVPHIRTREARPRSAP
jgi:hypothetical protein